MHPGNGAEGPLTPGLVFEMLQAYQRTAALKAAILPVGTMMGMKA